MKYLLLIVNAENDWQGLGPAEQHQVIERMNRFDDELRRAGQFVACGGLAPSTMAKTVRLAHGERIVDDGPVWRHPQTDHLVTGFFVVECPTTDEAVAWANKMPIAAGAIEVRPIAME